MVLKWVHFIEHVNLRAEIHCSIIKKVIMYKQDWEIISLTGSFYFARCQTMKVQILKATLRLHKVKRNLFVRMYIRVLQVICLFREMKKWHSAWAPLFSAQMDECNKIISSTKDIKQLLILDELQETNQMCCTENYSMIATDLCNENKLFFFFFTLFLQLGTVAN